MNGVPALRGARTTDENIGTAPRRCPDDTRWAGVANPNRIRVDAHGRPCSARHES
jgi:hypothetical protein